MHSESLLNLSTWATCLEISAIWDDWVISGWFLNGEVTAGFFIILEVVI